MKKQTSINAWTNYFISNFLPSRLLNKNEKLTSSPCSYELDFNKCVKKAREELRDFESGKRHRPSKEYLTVVAKLLKPEDLKRISELFLSISKPISWQEREKKIRETNNCEEKIGDNMGGRKFKSFSCKLKTHPLLKGKISKEVKFLLLEQETTIDEYVQYNQKKGLFEISTPSTINPPAPFIKQFFTNGFNPKLSNGYVFRYYEKLLRHREMYYEIDPKGNNLGATVGVDVLKTYDPIPKKTREYDGITEYKTPLQKIEIRKIAFYFGEDKHREGQWIEVTEQEYKKILQDFKRGNTATLRKKLGD